MPNKYKAKVSWTVECDVEVKADSVGEAREMIYSMGIHELRNTGRYNDYVDCSMFVEKIEKAEGALK